MQKKQNYKHLTLQEKFFANWFSYSYIIITSLFILIKSYNCYKTSIDNVIFNTLTSFIKETILATLFYFICKILIFIFSKTWDLISWPIRNSKSKQMYGFSAQIFPVKYQVGRYKLSDSQLTSVTVSYLDNTADVWSYFLNTKFQINNLIVSRSTPYSRENAAYFDINAGLLRERKRIISQNIVTRNSDDRKRSLIAGWPDTNTDKMYHRTHLIPFRYTLSEGYDIPGLLFTGTSQLNSGNRPLLNYTVADSGFLSHKKRQKLLLKYFSKYKGKPLENAYIKNMASISKNYSDDNFIFSLDDFERLSDYYIEHSPTHNFRYGTFTDANFDSLKLIPESASVYLYDMTTKQFCFQATLPNIN